MKQGSDLWLRCYFCLAATLLGAGAANTWCAPAPRAQDQGNNEWSLKTPSGGVEVSASAKASQIGLPVYPGARVVSERDKSQTNLTFSLTRDGKPDVKFLVAKFETADAIGRVRDFYKKKLGDKVTKFEQDSGDGSISFEMKVDNQHGKFVQLKASDGKTEIDLVRIEGLDLSDASVK